jgi:ABC-type branched-subunit amino acid transport system ATPase component/ABC-type branched-subunit amino acid transport system permease subunit
MSVVARKRRPAAPAAWLPALRKQGWLGQLLIFAVVLLVPIVSSGTSNLSRYESVLITLLVVLGLNLMFGYAGELSIGQPVILGVAAYGAGVLSSLYGWSAFATFPISMFIGLVAALVMNSVGLRVKGWYLAVTTFFAVTVLPDLLNVFDKWTQGSNGLGGINPIPGLNLSATGNSVSEYELVAVIVAAVWLAFRNLQTSRWGITLRAMRDCRHGLVASGGNLTAIRFAVTVVAALPVALGGWLTAHVNLFLVPDSFGLNQLLVFIGAVLLGGRGTVWGPVIGTVIFEGISLWVGPFSTINELVLGAAVLFIAAIFPVGLIGAWREFAPTAVRWWRSRLGNPAVVADVTKSDARPQIVDTNSLREFAPQESSVTDGQTILSVENVGKSFGGVAALDNVSIGLKAGAITGLVGPNGSGKTTALNVITGFVKADSGRVLLGGSDVTGTPAQDISRRGIRRSFQTPQLVGELTVSENVLLGLTGADRQRVLSATFRGVGYRRRSKALSASVQRAVQALGLDAYADVRVDELALGLRRIVEIARVVVACPQVICLDEPAAGLAEDDIRRLGAVLRQLADLGFAVLLIEHHLAFVNAVSDTLVSLDFGRVVSTEGRVPSDFRSQIPNLGTGGPPSPSVSLPASARVRKPAIEAPRQHPVKDELLTVDELSAWYGQAQALSDVTLRVGEGEIVGILGANGAGKSTLLRSVARIHRKATGSVSFSGQELLSLQPAVVASLGVSLVREGAVVFPNLSVAEHLGFARQLSRRRNQAWRGDDQVWEWLPFLHERRNVKAGLLSGGQRQLLALAMTAMSNPGCMLLDEPSAGLAESVRQSVFDLVRSIAEQGSTLLIAEQSDRWLRGLATRTYELEVGQIVHEAEWSRAAPIGAR